MALIIGRPFTGVFWGLEAVHSAIIALICFIIYFKTREIQQLSLHEGVRYFRKTFLLFGIASLLKLLTRHLAVSFFLYPGILGISGEVIALGVLSILYAHTMAAFYLLYSLSWKNLDWCKPWLMHIGALLIALTVLITNAQLLYLAFQVLLIAYSIRIIHGKKPTQILVISELLLIFWTISLVDTLMPITPVWQILNYIVSFSIFLMILHKVQNRLKVIK